MGFSVHFNEASINHQYELFKQQQATIQKEKLSFTPPFKRLNQKETLTCLQHGWTGTFEHVKATIENRPENKHERLLNYYANTGALGKTAQYLSKKDYVSCKVIDPNSRKYRMVDFNVIQALEKQGLIEVEESEGVFKLKRFCGEP